jgi:arylsulfatase A-like enzyme
LQSVGYSTALFGKWHLGGNRPELRNPSRQGFDEYYGIPRTSNEAQTTIAQGDPDAGGPAVAPLMRLFNLLSDPKEETDIKDANPWVRSVTDRIVNEFTATVERYPHVPANAPDPYSPPH